MSSQNNKCENCDEQYTDIYIKWCKSCHINYLKNNFTTWTSGNEKIDTFIRKIQLRIIYYSDKVVEWIPYNQLIDIKKIRNDDDNVDTISAIWNNGPLEYNINEKKWTRKSKKKVTLKWLAFDVDEFLNEVEYYSINNKIYGVSQNLNTKYYIIVCQDEYCDKCGKRYTDLGNKWCKPCHINYLINDFTNWTSGNEQIDIFIQEMQLGIDYYGDIVVEWIPYNQLIDIKEIRNDDNNVAIIYSAIWNNGLLNYDNNEKKWIRKSNGKVTLKCLALNINEFLNEVKNYIISNKIYGISQNPNTKNYIIVCQDEYCENCGEQYTDIDITYNKWCKPCQINYLKDNFINWTSGNKEIDIFIQKMQLKISNNYDTITEWIPYSQLINIEELANDKDNVVTICSAIWNTGPLNYNNDESRWTRESNKRVTLKCLELDINEFLNEAEKNSISNKIVYGISQNPNTKDYIIVCQNEYCEKCRELYTDIDITYNKWCKPCQMNYLKGNFTKWTSGNQEIDVFIQEMQLKISNNYDIIVEWIPFNQLIDIIEIGNDNDTVIYSAIWNNGPLNYNNDERKWIRESDKEVALITFNCSDSLIDKFLYKARNYSINIFDRTCIYGISQNPDTEIYILVLQDQYCENCSNQYIDLENKWCKQCQKNYLINDFVNWTSGNEKIDEFIQGMQLKIDMYDDIIVEWIPFNQFDYIKEIGRGGFATVYSAIWKNGPLEYNGYKKRYERVYFKEVALKCLDNSQNITNEFLNEVKTYSINSYDHSTIVKIYGISQNLDTKNYIIVLQYVKCGNFNNWIHYYCKNLDYEVKLNVLHYIFNGLKEIHQKQMIHRDFHAGNILINNNYSMILRNNHSYRLSTNINLPIAAYISDMGLCGEVSNTDKTNIYGVMPYVAPEVLRGKPYTQAADVYSFGMIMYFILTGRQPFDNRAHDHELALNICNGIRPEIPKIPELESNWYINLMKKCWDSNPDNRPNVELIDTILDGKNDHEEFKKAEKYLFKYKENDRLTVHPQAVYTSRLLNPYTESLVFDFTKLDD
ncbi:hypothetical protein RclHR1_13000005 [Rhizophagus clarus]|uniref:Protein kinase domain-containing protein n=1 Tax=Rhizophagus clarus TaxID=94130 RepID=A0A2Z6Q918_9GLOM|nr:hypothetical protein RclHR1_13000005 [Rhizophagus clarus]